MKQTLQPIPTKVIALVHDAMHIYAASLSMLYSMVDKEENRLEWEKHMDRTPPIIILAILWVNSTYKHINTQTSKRIISTQLTFI